MKRYFRVLGRVQALARAILIGGMGMLSVLAQSLPKGVIADSSSAWEADGAQPDGAWEFGYYASPEDATTFERSSVWRTYYSGPNSWIGALGEIWDSGGYPRLGKYAIAPSPSNPVVRRWVSNYKGEVTLLVDCQQLQDSLNDQAFSLYRNGVLERHFQKSETSHHLIFAEFCEVEVGDQLDFVIDSLGNANADWTHVSVRVVTQRLADDALFHYPFNEFNDLPTGWEVHGPLYDRRSRVGDFSGADNHAVLVNMDRDLASVSGIHDQAREFDGVDDYLLVEKEDVGDGLEELTLSAWIKPSSKGDFEGIVTSTGSDYQGLLISGYGNGNPVEFRVKSQFIVAPDNSCPVDEWSHIVGVWESGRVQKLYINGELVASHTSPLSGPLDVADWLIGSDRNLPNRHFHGALDEVSLIPRAMEDWQVRELFRERAPFPGITGPADYYDGVHDSDIRETSENGSSELTLAAWINPFTRQDNAGIVSSIGPDFFGLILSGYGKGTPVEFRAKSSRLTAADYSCPSGEWNHIVGVWKSGEIQKLYINGQEVADSANPPSGTVDITHWLIGRDRDFSNRFYQGLVDDLAILPQALNATEVDALYREHLPPNTAEPVRMDGFISYDIWTGVGGLVIQNLRDSEKFLNPPRFRQFLPVTEGYSQWGDSYGSRLRGYITPTETGDYTFWAALADDVEVWLSSDTDKFKKKLILSPRLHTRSREWDKDVSQRSKPITLEAGESYYIEVLHKAGPGGDHVSLAWTTPSGGRNVIQSQYLSPYVLQENDLDDDDLDDNYENANGLSSSDNGSVDPNNGAFGDLDGDGLTNAEEFRYGTYADQADSDNDGIDDATEIRLLETDAIIDDVDPFLPLVSVDGSSFTGQFGDWIVDDTAARHTQVRGWLEYSIQVPRKGVYLLEADLSSYIGGDLSDEYEVIFTLDGVELERSIARVPDDGQGSAKALTQWLHPGIHILRVFVDNALTYRKAKVHQIRLSLSQGPNMTWGRPGWVDQRLRRTNGLDINQNLPLKSLVSPACIEGHARHFSLTTAKANGQPIDLQLAPSDRWYVNVPLKENSNARTTVNFEFESNSFRGKQVIQWQMTNLLEVTPPAIRVGDSLQLTAWSTANNKQRPRGNEDVTLLLDGQTYTFKANKPLIYQFDAPGVYPIDVTHTFRGQTATNQVTVKVVAPVELGSPVCVEENYREWELPELDSAILLELDDRLDVRETNSRLDGGFTYIMRLHGFKECEALLRLGEGGSVLTTTTVRSMRVRTAEETSTEFLESYPDGSYLVEMPVVADGIYDDIEFRYVIFLAGTIFDDGSLEKDMPPSLFDEYGTAKVRFLKTGNRGSICHHGYVYQNGKRIALMTY